MDKTDNSKIDHYMVDYNELRRKGDLLAIPFFLLAIYYFYNKEEKELIELILFVFVIVGLAFDLTMSFY